MDNIYTKYETLQQTLIRRKLGFFGHVMQSDGLEKGMTWRGKEKKRTTKEKMDV